LGLIQVDNRLDMGRSVAVLDEETLVVFETIWRADYGVIETIRVVVLKSLAQALLEAGGGDNLQVFIEAQWFLVHRALWRLRDQAKVVDTSFGAAGDSDFHAPVFFIFRQYPAHGLVACFVTADRRQCRRDIEGFRAHAQMSSE